MTHAYSVVACTVWNFSGMKMLFLSREALGQSCKSWLDERLAVFRLEETGDGQFRVHNRPAAAPRKESAEAYVGPFPCRRGAGCQKLDCGAQPAHSLVHN